METQKLKLAKKKISDDVRTSGENSDSIPLDLIPDILKALPVKTLARFLCVSKPWASIIRNRDFVKSYLNKSPTHPQGLIFTFKSKRHGKHFFFSSSQRKDGDDESSSPVATYHMKCNSQPYTAISPSVHGLICYGPPSKLMIYNPSTRRSIALPKIDSQRTRMYHFLGYDPIDGEYKMLCMSRGMHVRRGRGLAQKIQVLTLGNGNSWRMIENCPPHSPESTHICLDGVLYYGAYLNTGTRQLRKDHVVMSFDVRSEKFELIQVPPERARTFNRMTRYNGKLAIMFTGYGGFGYCYSGYIQLWVLEDAATHEWSNKNFVLPRTVCRKTLFQIYCAIDDDSGEFVLAPETLRAPPFYVLYYDPKRNSMRRVDIEGVTEKKMQFWDDDSDRRTISIFPGQVENLIFL